MTTSTSSTSSTEALENLHETLEPLADLHGQHNQLESWVNDSCQALEKLHGELAEWQNELARKQTELDLREDALDRNRVNEDELGSQAELWKADLEITQQRARQFEEENADQIEQLEQLERRCIELEAELKTTRQQNDKLTAKLELDRTKTAEEQLQWKEEFKGMRKLLDKQCSLLTTQIQPTDQQARASTPAESLEIAARSQDLRRRALTRLAEKRRQQQKQDPEDPAKS